MGSNPKIILNMIRPIHKTYTENPKVIDFFTQIDKSDI